MIKYRQSGVSSSHCRGGHRSLQKLVSIAQLFPAVPTFLRVLVFQCLVSAEPALDPPVLSRFSFVTLTFHCLEFTGASTFIHTIGIDRKATGE